MKALASQITSVSIVYSTVCSGTDQRKHQSFTSPVFVRGFHQRAFNTENISIWYLHHVTGKFISIHISYGLNPSKSHPLLCLTRTQFKWAQLNTNCQRSQCSTWTFLGTHPNAHFEKIWTSNTQFLYDNRIFYPLEAWFYPSGTGGGVVR